jgi:hypothetical protein
MDPIGVIIDLVAEEVFFLRSEPRARVMAVIFFFFWF